MSRLIQKCVERGIEVSRGVKTYPEVCRGIEVSRGVRGVKTYPEVCRERYRGVQGCQDLSRGV